MKKLTTILVALALILCIVTHAYAWKLQWTTTGNYDGITLNWRPLNAAAWTTVDVGRVTEYVIDTLPMTAGTRYEFQVQARYLGSVSGPSDTVRWTFPAPSQVIEYPSAPSSIILQFGQ